jgi:hypothetical protein
VPITGVTVYIEPKGSDRNFGSCGSPEETLLTRSSTGGSNPLSSGTTIPGPENAVTCFTLDITDSGIQDVSEGTDYKVHVVVEFTGHHGFPGGRDTQVCGSVSVA